LLQQPGGSDRSMSSQASTARASIVTPHRPDGRRGVRLAPSVNRLGQALLFARSDPVPSVNRSGKHCYLHVAALSPGSTARASIVTIAAGRWTAVVPNVNRSGRYCHARSATVLATSPKRQPLGQALSQSLPIQLSFRTQGRPHVPNVNRLGRYCHQTQVQQYEDAVSRPKRQPLEQVLSPSLACPRRPKRQPLGQVLSP
jgi:hypothetical protein